MINPPRDVGERPDYLSYLLHLWRANDDPRTAWRASVEHSLSGERITFASLEDLFTFLRRRTGLDEDGDKDEPAE